MAAGCTVGRVARIAGVTVRTLRHYGEIGLLNPTHRSVAGYRLYSDTDLERLGRILFYRELGFSLETIRALLDDPSIDRLEHMRRQHQLLLERFEKIQAMVAAVEKELEAYMAGINLTPEEKLEVFGKSYDEAWEQEAQERWGNTDAWRESQERVSRLGKEDWVRVREGTDALHQRLVEGFTSGVSPDSTEAMALAEQHRQWVGQFTACPADHHRGLAEMYLQDPRFTKTYEDLAPGLAQWLHDAIHTNADRLDRDGAE
jgi:DNA-binding transcriptional MerR regulator